MKNIRRMRPVPVLLVMGAALLGCGPKSDGVYTLYRNSPVGDTMRIHVATFDAADGSDYNIRNCEIAKTLFAEQPGVTARYWCEKGRYSR